MWSYLHDCYGYNDGCCSGASTKFVLIGFHRHTRSTHSHVVLCSYIFETKQNWISINLLGNCCFQSKQILRNGMKKFWHLFASFFLKLWFENVVNDDFT